MLEHKQIWQALDLLAERHSLSVSALAKLAGLDPTTFNKSKRQASDGKPRWPSTESLSKVLIVLGVDFDDFAALAVQRGQRASGRPVPLIGLAQAGSDGFFDDAGFPVGGGWEEIRMPGVVDENCYALEISGDSMAPLMRHGDKVLVAPNAQIRRGDRVVVKTMKGEVMAKEIGKMSATHVELISLNPDYSPRVLDRFEILWMARIVWISQ